MGITGNEVSAANQQRRNEEIPSSAVGNAMGAVTSVVGPAVALSTSLVGGVPVGLAIAGSVVAGMGIVDWFRKLGTSKVDENLEALGQATEDAFSRVENVLKEHGAAIDEIKRRFKSKELQDAMASASLHALRTTQRERLNRLALILANGVKDKDLASENTDDMMRAAVELSETDIDLLVKICASQSSILRQKGLNSTNWFSQVQERWDAFVSSGALDPSKHLFYRSSLLRLESHGLVQQFPLSISRGIGYEAYALLEEGMRFYEHLQEIAKGES